MELAPLGDSAVLIRLDAQSPTPADLNGWVRALDAARPAWVREVNTGIASLAVYYDPAHVLRIAQGGAYETVCAWIQSCAPAAHGGGITSRRFVIPVCYGGEYGPDLAAVAELTGLTPSEVIVAHWSAEYTVQTVGFSPGFPYLSGLPPQLAVPRRTTPRLSVPAGSVAIGGSQAGIYPGSTPGGWRVVGRTPWLLFDPFRDEPAALRMGDVVTFSPVDADSFASEEKKFAMPQARGDADHEHRPRP